MKHFEPGQRVEIQRDVGAMWEPAFYSQPAADHRGWHNCRDTARPRDAVEGFYLPTQRIRLRGSGRDKYRTYWHLTVRMLDMLESIRDTGSDIAHLRGQSQHGGANATRGYLQQHGLISWAENGWTLSPAAIDAIAHREPA